MFEIAGFLTLLLIGAVVFGLFALLGLAFKLVFKIVLLPFALLGFLFKALFAILAVVIGLVLAPMFFVVVGAILVAFAIPLLLLAGVVSAGFALAT